MRKNAFVIIETLYSVKKHYTKHIKGHYIKLFMKKRTLLVDQWFTKRNITIAIVALSFFIRLIRLDVPHEWSFDEVYHALSAEAYALNDPRGYEWWNESPKDLAYEWLHPPIGKLFMAASIKLFATPYIPESKAAPLSAETTFAWRFPGIIFAALTVFLLIRFGEKLFGQFWVGAVAGLFYALDGLSFVQSRTGMNDIYITFFVVLVFYRLYIFLIEYPKKSIKNLAWIGMASGLAASTKWTGFYVVAIAFIWGAVFLLKKRNWKMVLASFVYLAVIPLALYITSYTQWWIQGHSLQQFYELHQQIWWYQTGLKATHDYQSKAYTWPFLIRPVWFYVKYEDVFKNGIKELYIGNIYTMGHPLIWWSGILGIGYAGWLVIKKNVVRMALKLTGAMKDSAIKKYLAKTSGQDSQLTLALLIILVGYFGMFLPWVLSPRIMFLYHYLPSVPFLCLLLAYGLYILKQQGRQSGYLVNAFIILIILGFVFFYPHWTGVLLPQKWNSIYYWLPTWK